MGRIFLTILFQKKNNFHDSNEINIEKYGNENILH